MVYGAVTSWVNGDGEPLSELTRRIMKEFFPADVLTSARLCEHASLLGARWVTIDTTIYTRGSFRECGEGDTLRWLAHELVHVMQYRGESQAWFLTKYGSEAALRLEWASMGPEVEAENYVREIFDRLLTSQARECLALGQCPPSPRRSDWFWVLHAA